MINRTCLITKLFPIWKDPTKISTTLFSIWKVERFLDDIIPYLKNIELIWGQYYFDSKIQIPNVGTLFILISINIPCLKKQILSTRFFLINLSNKIMNFDFWAFFRNFHYFVPFSEISTFLCLFPKFPLFCAFFRNFDFCAVLAPWYMHASIHPLISGKDTIAIISWKTYCIYLCFAKIIKFIFINYYIN